jgi:hypothetical protein
LNGSNILDTNTQLEREIDLEIEKDLQDFKELAREQKLSKQTEDFLRELEITYNERSKNDNHKSTADSMSSKDTGVKPQSTTDLRPNMDGNSTMPFKTNQQLLSRDTQSSFEKYISNSSKIPEKKSSEDSQLGSSFIQQALLTALRTLQDRVALLERERNDSMVKIKELETKLKDTQILLQNEQESRKKELGMLDLSEKPAKVILRNKNQVERLL